MRRLAEAVNAVSLWIVVSADASQYHDSTDARLVATLWAKWRNLQVRRPANQPDVKPA